MGTGPLAKRIWLTNAVAYFGCAVFVASLPWDLATAPRWMIGEDILGALIYLSFPFLNRHGHHTAARVGVVTLSNLIVFANAVALTHDSGAHIVLIALISLPFALFDFRQVRWHAYSIALSLGCLLLAESGVLAGVIEASPGFVPSSYYPYSVVVAITALLFSLYQTSRANADAEDALLKDIHERDRMASELDATRQKAFHAARLAALGQMSGGIAHEVNNPLSAIALRAGQLRHHASTGRLDPKKVGDVAVHIESIVERIQKIIGSLRSFARDGDGDPTTSEPVSAIVQTTVELCAPRFKQGGVALEVAPLGGDTKMDCRAVQVSQVLVNLLNNAFDAARSGDKPWVRLTVEEDAAEVRIVVTDSGKAIPADVQDHLMEPFFTTKAFGEGTGLGLSVSKGLAESNGGTLRYDPSAKNTRFVLTLKRSR